jgi:hypothetical protein
MHNNLNTSLQNLFSKIWIEIIFGSYEKPELKTSLRKKHFVARLSRPGESLGDWPLTPALLCKTLLRIATMCQRACQRYVSRAIPPLLALFTVRKNAHPPIAFSLLTNHSICGSSLPNPLPEIQRRKDLLHIFKNLRKFLVTVCVSSP